MRMFVSFEGIDGSGKTTQAGLLAETLAGLGRNPLLVREPGGTATGERIRELLLHRRLNISTEAEILLYTAARAELLREVIFPALETGRPVLCDRYIDSSLAYQGYGLGGDLSWIRELNCRIGKGLWPDLTFLLDLQVEQAADRRSGSTDRVEQREAEFHQRVRRGYLDLASREPERFVIMDALLPVNKLRQIIWECLRQRGPALGVK